LAALQELQEKGFLFKEMESPNQEKRCILTKLKNLKNQSWKN
jgi:hypothetical protein